MLSQKNACVKRLVLLRMGVPFRFLRTSHYSTRRKGKTRAVAPLRSCAPASTAQESARKELENMSIEYSKTIIAEKILSSAIAEARKKLDACPLPSTLEEVQDRERAFGELLAYNKAYDLLVALSADYSESYKALQRETLELRGAVSYYKSELKRYQIIKRIGP